LGGLLRGGEALVGGFAGAGLGGVLLPAIGAVLVVAARMTASVAGSSSRSVRAATVCKVATRSSPAVKTVCSKWAAVCFCAAVYLVDAGVRAMVVLIADQAPAVSVARLINPIISTIGSSGLDGHGGVVAVAQDQITCANALIAGHHHTRSVGIGEVVTEAPVNGVRDLPLVAKDRDSFPFGARIGVGGGGISGQCIECCPG
jgi:hypothetical protein